MFAGAVLNLLAVTDLRLPLISGVGTTDASTKGAGATWAACSPKEASFLFDMTTKVEDEK